MLFIHERKKSFNYHVFICINELQYKNFVFFLRRKVTDKTNQSQEKTYNYFIEEKTHICKYSAVFIIIDGYNLIRQSSTLRRYELKSLEAGRQALVSRLSDYQSKKGHTITVVFDGWQGGSEYEERDRYGGIDIIYSHYAEKIRRSNYLYLN